MSELQKGGEKRGGMGFGGRIIRLFWNYVCTLNF